MPTYIRDGGTWKAVSGEGIVPSGSVIFVAKSTVPTGYLACNGAEALITAYITLYNALTNSGTTFPFGANTNGSGAAGSTHFRLPDLRGEFLRGWDDSRGVDTGRVFGSAQTDLFKSHQHGFPPGVGNNTGTYIFGRVMASGGFTGGTIVTNLEGGTETRPRNVALLACIKY